MKPPTGKTPATGSKPAALSLAARSASGSRHLTQKLETSSSTPVAEVVAGEPDSVHATQADMGLQYKSSAQHALHCLVCEVGCNGLVEPPASIACGIDEHHGMLVLSCLKAVSSQDVTCSSKGTVQ